MQRYEHSVLEVTSLLHSYARGTLQATPEEMKAQFDWLSWRLMEGWVDNLLGDQSYRFDVGVWNLAYRALHECQKEFSWEKGW